jgi:LmbE family N-acetylglucosaminyl deacetylase
MDFAGVDIPEKKRGGLEVLFPGFAAAEETVVVFSPHDDDGILGAGYIIQAALEAGARVRVLIFCDGRAGYSRVEDKAGIVARRKRETEDAYAVLGVTPDMIARLELPDFSALHYLGWQLPGGGSGLFGRIVPLLRKWQATRLLIPNGHREHIDHAAAHLAGIYFGPQSGDAVVAEWGRADPVKNALVYSVWADFPSPPDRALLGPAAAEEKVMSALRLFASQSAVIADLVQARAQRLHDGQALELYLATALRPPLDYKPYWEKI